MKKTLPKNRRIGCSTLARLQDETKKLESQGYIPMGPHFRTIRLWSGNLYQMIFVQDLELKSVPQEHTV